MLEPTRPANTSAEMVGLNSRIVESRAILPAILSGTSGLDSWKATWIVVAAPINTDMIEIIPNDPMPTDTISRITSAQYTLNFSGFLKLKRSKSMYLPKLSNICSYKNRLKIRFFTFKVKWSGVKTSHLNSIL
jgi:hypothetical protein